MFGGQSTVVVPMVRQGLSIDPEAKIGGNLDYTQNADLVFPAGVVAGKVTRSIQPEQTTEPTPEKSATQKVTDWIWKSGRSLVTLLLIGLFLLWLFPIFTASISQELETKPLPSLGWGVVAYAGFFFLLLLVVFVMILGAILFGLMTLGGLSATIVFVGLLALFGLVLGFVLATSFFSKIIVCRFAIAWPKSSHASVKVAGRSSGRPSSPAIATRSMDKPRISLHTANGWDISKQRSAGSFPGTAVPGAAHPCGRWFLTLSVNSPSQADCRKGCAGRGNLFSSNRKP